MNSLLRSWIRLGLRHPKRVLVLSTLVTLAMAVYAKNNFVLRSNLGALLPANSVSVENQSWIQAHMGAPSLIQPIIRTTEPQADRVVFKRDNDKRWSTDIAHAVLVDGNLELRLRAPLFKTDGPHNGLLLRLSRRPHDPVLYQGPEWST